MKTNQQFLKLFVVLLFGTAFIFSFSHYGAKAFGKNSNTDGTYSEGTAIGALDISGKTEGESIRLLEQKYTDWVEESSMELQYGEMTVSMDLSEFQLDAKQTVESVKDGQKNTAVITVNKEQVGKQLQLLFPQLNSNDFDLERLTQELNLTSSQFEMDAHAFNLYDDYLLDSERKDVDLNTAILELDEIPNQLKLFIEKNPAIELKNGASFSFLKFANKHNLDDPYSLDVLATGIYQAVLPSNLTIVERNISSSIPNYAAVGFEAKVNENRNVDLILTNPNKTQYILQLQLENEKLLVTLKGQKFAYNYKVSTKDEQKLKFKTIVQYSPLLLPGKTKVQTPGTEGQVIKVYRDVYQGGAFITSELISEDYYPPTYQVEIHGLAVSDQGTATTTTTSSQTTIPTNSTVNQTQTQIQSTTESNQQEATESDIWGIPNEQPK